MRLAVRAASTALGTVLYVVLSAIGAFYLWLEGALDCYESCSEQDPGWSNHTASWQWDAMYWSGAAAGLAATVVLVAALARRPRVAAGAIALQVAGLCVGASFVTDDPGRSVAVPFAVVWIVAVLASGAAFVRRRRRG